MKQQQRKKFFVKRQTEKQNSHAMCSLNEPCNANTPTAISSLSLSLVRASARVSLSAFVSTQQCQNEELQAAFCLAGYRQPKRCIKKLKPLKLTAF
jgi:hypothetical protein